MKSKVKLNKRITQKVNMFVNVSLVLVANQSIVDSVAAMKNLTTLFNDGLKTIETLMRSLLLDSTGIAKDKRSAKEDLATKLAAICGAMKAYASSRKNITLRTKADLSYSDLLRKRDTELQETAEALLALANANATALQDYLVTPADLTALTDAIKLFKEDNPKVRLNKVNTKTDRASLEEEVYKVNELLRTQMDNIVLMLSTSQRAFAELYDNARRNYIVSIRHEQPENGEATVAPEAQSLLAMLQEMAANQAEQSAEGATNGQLLSEAPMG